MEPRLKLDERIPGREGSHLRPEDVDPDHLAEDPEYYSKLRRVHKSDDRLAYESALAEGYSEEAADAIVGGADPAQYRDRSMNFRRAVRRFIADQTKASAMIRKLEPRRSAGVQKSERLILDLEKSSGTDLIGGRPQAQFTGYTRVPGQVPGHTVSLADRPRLDPDLERELTARPPSWSTQRHLDTHPMTPRDVVANLGLSKAVESRLAKLVAREVLSSRNRVELAKSLLGVMVGEGMDQDVRTLVSHRALQLYRRVVRKSGFTEVYRPEELLELRKSSLATVKAELVHCEREYRKEPSAGTRYALAMAREEVLLLGDVQKSGPYYGPRGGKWADLAHTIPWKESASIGGFEVVKQTYFKLRSFALEQEGTGNLFLSPPDEAWSGRELKSPYREHLDAVTLFTNGDVSRIRQGEGAQQVDEDVEGVDVLHPKGQVQWRVRGNAHTYTQARRTLRAYANFPVDEGKVYYRGLHLPSAVVEGLVEGVPLDLGFVSSWTSNPDQALEYTRTIRGYESKGLEQQLSRGEKIPVVLRIKPTRGADVSFMSKWQSLEKEFVTGGPTVVKSVEKKGGVLWVELEQK